jgi:hypothetical protein
MLPIAALVLIAALLLGNHLRMQWIASTIPIALPTHQPAAAAATSDAPEMPNSAVPIDPTASAVRRAADIRGALESTRRQLDPDSPLLSSLSEEARVACAIVRRPDASARRVESDPNRRVWLDQLLRRCAGLLDTDLAPPNPSESAIALWNQQLPLIAALRASIDAGDKLAQQHIVRSADPRLLAESLRFLLDQERLPLAQIFHGVAPPSRVDIEAALIFAADWIGCLRSDSCGADGLWTLYTCAQFGCPDGSDLPRAYYRILPAQQYEIARRLVRWATMR